MKQIIVQCQQNEIY